MYSIFHNVPLRALLYVQAPALLASFVIAELFYKFHSFTLECLAFLGTWLVLDFVGTTVRNFLMDRSGSATADAA
jgi:hypothetical protein